MRQRAMDKKTLQVEGTDRKLSLVRSKRYSVDYKRLNAVLDPETRAQIVTESVSEYVRVS